MRLALSLSLARNLSSGPSHAYSAHYRNLWGVKVSPVHKGSPVTALLLHLPSSLQKKRRREKKEGMARECLFIRA